MGEGLDGVPGVLEYIGEGLGARRRLEYPVSTWERGVGLPEGGGLEYLGNDALRQPLREKERIKWQRFKLCLLAYRQCNCCNVGHCA